MSACDPMFDESDLSEDRFHCKHGTFIGNPYGGDYMCGWCESGEEPPTQAEVDASELAAAEKAFTRLVDALEAIESPSVRHNVMIRLIEWVATPRVQAAWDRVNG